jgi:hypothetical protein
MAKMTPQIGKRKAKVKFGLTLRRIVLLGTPLVLTVLMIFHPSPYDDVAGELMPIAGWWIALHTIGFVLFALMGVAVWMLTAGLRDVLPLSAGWQRWSLRCSTMSGTP